LLTCRRPRRDLAVTRLVPRTRSRWPQRVG
jgi:hypothetical protein